MVPMSMRERRSKAMRLPPLDDDRIPAWRFTRHATTVILGLFGVLVGGGGVTAALVTVDVPIVAEGVLESSAGAGGRRAVLTLANRDVTQVRIGGDVAIEVLRLASARAGHLRGEVESIAGYRVVVRVDTTDLKRVMPAVSPDGRALPEYGVRGHLGTRTVRLSTRLMEIARGRTRGP